LVSKKMKDIKNNKVKPMKGAFQMLDGEKKLYS
jgi:hypothetical protein